MKNSPKRLLLLAITVVALALVIAPASFAGEDDGQGPTQAGETQNAPSGPESPAVLQGPAQQSAPAPAKTSKSSSGSKAKVLGAERTASRTVVKTTRTADTVRARGGIQAGFGGMATEATSLPALLASMTGVLLLIGAASIFVPSVRRSQH